MTLFIEYAQKMAFEGTRAAKPGDQNDCENWLDLDGAIVQVY